MPPSTVNGKAYQWLTGRSPDKQQLADAPQWLLDRMSGKATTSATNGTTSKPNKLHEAVFTRLANQCSLFKLHLQEQKTLACQKMNGTTGRVCSQMQTVLK